MQYVINNTREWTTSTLFESEGKVHFVRFMKDDSLLFFSFSKEVMAAKGENIPAIYDKIMVLVKTLEDLEE